MLKEKKQQNKLVIILGPTSSGKTALAVALAKKFCGEIVSADSRQIYKGMDIGTGKDLKAYGSVPYHLIDVANPKKRFTLADYQHLAYTAIDNIIKRGKTPFLVGGSGLYINSIALGYSLTATKPDYDLRKTLAKKTLIELQKIANTKKIKLNQSDYNNKRRLIRKIEAGNTNNPGFRPKYNCLIIGLNPGKKILDQKIKQRLLQMINKEGLIAEVKKLKKDGLSWKKLEDFGLEYRFVAQYLQGKIDQEAMLEKLNIAIRQFAKRQLTWFLGQAKKNKQTIHWLKSAIKTKTLIDNFLKK